MTSSLVFAFIAALPMAEPAAPPIVALAIAPDGMQVLAASQAGVQVFSLPKLEKVQSLNTQLAHVHDLSFSPDGKSLAIAGGSPSEQGKVELWQWPLASLRKTLNAGSDVAYSLAWNADASQLAVACGDKRIRIVRADGGEIKAVECHSAAALAAVWLTADNLVLSAGLDQSIRVLEPATGKIRRSLDNHTGAVRAFAVRPGGHDGPALVASCSADRTVRFWQPTIGRLVRFVRLPSQPAAICWTIEGSQVLAACEDGLLRAVDPETVGVAELEPRLDGAAYAVAVLPDGRSAVVGGAGGQLRIIPLDAIKP